ncbi:MAG: NTP transferase domain-containing protein [Bacteroidota bacterium]
MNKNNTAALILAAGSSQRMASPKALLQFNEDMTFLEKIVKTYAEWGCNKIVAVVNPSLDAILKKMNLQIELVTFVVNDHPEHERFYSVKLGLRKVTLPFCFIQNVDNPFIDEIILDEIYSHRSTEKYVSPIFNGQGGHPVLLNQKNIISISTHEDNSANFKELMQTYDCYRLEMNDSRVLININSPEEYEKVFNDFSNKSDN